VGRALADGQPVLAYVAVRLDANVLPARLASQVKAVVRVDEGQPVLALSDCSAIMSLTAMVNERGAGR
jgi:hypothetical protein